MYLLLGFLIPSWICQTMLSYNPLRYSISLFRFINEQITGQIPCANVLQGCWLGLTFKLSYPILHLFLFLSIFSWPSLWICLPGLSIFLVNLNHHFYKIHHACLFPSMELSVIDACHIKATMHRPPPTHTHPPTTLTMSLGAYMGLGGGGVQETYLVIHFKEMKGEGNTLFSQTLTVWTGWMVDP